MIFTVMGPYCHSKELLSCELLAISAAAAAGTLANVHRTPTSPNNARKAGAGHTMYSMLAPLSTLSMTPVTTWRRYELRFRPICCKLSLCLGVRGCPRWNPAYPEVEVTEIILTKVSRLCHLSSHSRGFLSRL